MTCQHICDIKLFLPSRTQSINCNKQTAIKFNSLLRLMQDYKLKFYTFELVGNTSALILILDIYNSAREGFGQTLALFPSGHCWLLRTIPWCPHRGPNCCHGSTICVSTMLKSERMVKCVGIEQTN